MLHKTIAVNTAKTNMNVQESPFAGMKYIHHSLATGPLLTGHIWDLLAIGETPAPVTVDLDVSNDCTQACTWCNFMHMHKKFEYLDRQTGLELLNSLHTMGTRSILFSGGGEPTTNPYIADFINTCAELHIAVGLYTNGSILSDELLSGLQDAAHFVRISFEAGNEALYRALHRPKRPEHGFETVVRNISRYVETSLRSEHRFDVGISFLLCPENIGSIVETARLVKNIGVNYFQVKPEVLKPGHAQVVTRELLDRAGPLFEEIQALATDSFTPYILVNKLEEIATTQYIREYERCLGHFMAVKIAANGRVYLCAEHAGEDRYELGDLYREPFEHIWHGARRREVINNIDLNSCQWGCKGDTRTKVIENIKRIKHPDFI